MLTTEQAYQRLQSQSDEQLKSLLEMAGLSVLPFNRNNAINMLTGNCFGCKKEIGNMTITYTSPSGVSEPCKTCGN